MQSNVVRVEIPVSVIHSVLNALYQRYFATDGTEKGENVEGSASGRGSCMKSADSEMI